MKLYYIIKITTIRFHFVIIVTIIVVTLVRYYHISQPRLENFIFIYSYYFEYF